jgi:hypothetical protein
VATSATNGASARLSPNPRPIPIDPISSHGAPQRLLKSSEACFVPDQSAPQFDERVASLPRSLFDHAEPMLELGPGQRFRFQPHAAVPRLHLPRERQ